MTNDLQHAIEQFYYREARLLDERQYLQWLALLSEAITYRMPSRSAPMQVAAQRGTETYHAVDHELSGYGAAAAPLREENYFTLAIRADRGYKVNAWSENPPPSTRRFISNVEIVSDDNSGLRVFSNFQLFYNRNEKDSHIITGQRRDVLETHNGSFRILEREVILDTSHIAAPHVGLFF